MWMYIPRLGDKIRLSNDWHFMLHQERRNISLLKAFGLADVTQNGYSCPYYRQPPTEVRLCEGTVLTIDRIYVKRGGQEYASVTFRLPKALCTTPEINNYTGQVRFWAKLDDVNKITFERYEDEPNP